MMVLARVLPQKRSDAPPTSTPCMMRSFSMSPASADTHAQERIADFDPDPETHPEGGPTTVKN